MKNPATVNPRPWIVVAELDETEARSPGSRRALTEMVLGLQERDRVKEVFGRYVTTQVSEQVLKGSINLGGERRRVTMLFSDIRNFTAMSEAMPAEHIVEFLPAKINGERTVAGKPPIAIGIHTDDVIVGNIGSRRRLEYTVIVDGVNTCQRVESACSRS